MKVLGLMMVRNGAGDLPTCLQSMAQYCDWICVIEDRSTDRSREILLAHPAVTNVFSANAALSDENWFFTESEMLRFLYHMADFMRPDWVVLVDCDEVVKPAGLLREVLGQIAPDVAAMVTPRISEWNDPQYPLMRSLMLRSNQRIGNMWRYYPGLIAGEKALHNQRLPQNIGDFGRIEDTDVLEFHHAGWDTLEKRLQKVDLYTRIDPTYEHNNGVPYDKGLLFGYGRDRLDALIAEYRRRYDRHMQPPALRR
jgi:glycosyltransferase involved in cell wall biosynthesis